MAQSIKEISVWWSIVAEWLCMETSSDPIQVASISWARRRTVNDHGETTRYPQESIPLTPLLHWRKCGRDPVLSDKNRCSLGTEIRTQEWLQTPIFMHKYGGIYVTEQDGKSMFRCIPLTRLWQQHFQVCGDRNRDVHARSTKTTVIRHYRCYLPMVIKPETAHI